MTISSKFILLWHFVLILLLGLFDFSKYKIVLCSEIHVNHYDTSLITSAHKKLIYILRWFCLQILHCDKYQSTYLNTSHVFHVPNSKVYEMHIFWLIGSTCKESQLCIKLYQWIFTVSCLFAMKRHVTFLPRLYLWSDWWIPMVWLQVLSSFIF